MSSSSSPFVQDQTEDLQLNIRTVCHGGTSVAGLFAIAHKPSFLSDLDFDYGTILETDAEYLSLRIELVNGTYIPASAPDRTTRAETTAGRKFQKL